MEEHSKINLELIEEFLRDLEAQGKSKRRIEKYFYILRNIAYVLKKDFRDATKEDIQEFVIKLQKVGYKPATLADYKLFTKVFYRWLYPVDEDEKAYPKIVRWIKIGNSLGQEKLPEELLTQQDILSLIGSCSTSQDRLLVSLLYESGMRSGEIRSLQLKHVKFDDLGAIIQIPKSKTQPRRIRIYDSVPYLKEWINSINHDSESYLFCTKDGNKNPLSSELLISRIKEIASRAKMGKRIYPHLFRHSRATHLAGMLEEQILKNYMGWSKTSKMAAVYIHLSGKDMDKIMLSKVYNLSPESITKEPEEPLKPKVCVHCKFQNEASSKFCKSCYKPLDLSTMMQFEERRNLADAKLNELFSKKPEVVDILVKALLEIDQNK